MMSGMIVDRIAIKKGESVEAAGPLSTLPPGPG